MTCKIGPNRIRDNVVFHYDMDNLSKSWLGEPTANLIPNANKNGRLTIGNNWGTFGISKYNGNVYFSIGSIASISGNIVTTTANHPFNTFDACRPQTSGGGVAAGTDYFIKKISNTQFSIHAYNNSQDGSQGYIIPGSNFNKVHESIYLDQRVAINNTSFPTMWLGPAHLPNSDFVKEIKNTGGPQNQSFIRNHIIRNNTIQHGMAYGVNTPVTAGDKIGVSYWIRSNWQGVPLTYYTHFGGASAYGTTYNINTYWTKVTHTWTASATYAFIQYFYFKIPNDRTYWVDICDIQVEVNKQSTTTPFTISSRSNTQSLLDLTGNASIDVSNLTVNSNGDFRFNGTTDKLSISIPSQHKTISNDTNRSWEAIAIPDATLTAAGIFGTSYADGCTYFCNGGIVIWGGTYRFGWFDGSSYLWLDSGVIATANVPVHIIATWSKTDYKPRIYVNGELISTHGSATNLKYLDAQNLYQIGYLSGAGNRFSGAIPVVKFYYEKTLSAEEIKLNYESYKSRFNLP